MKLKLLLITLSIFCFSMNAQEIKQKSWRTLEQAELAYSKGNYGKSLKLAQKAKEIRKEESHYEFLTLDKALSPKQVTRVGTDFISVLPVLQERDETEAVRIIKKYTDLYSVDFFANDVTNLIKWVKNKEVYPEANFLIGKIYRLEGEYNTAYTFFDMALEQIEYLDVPDVKYDILYTMAQIKKDSGDDKSLEQILLLILDNDKNFKDKVLLNALIRNINQDLEQNVDKFFLFFRAEAYNSYKAIYELSKLYDKQNKEEVALKYTSLAVIEAFTHILSTIQERDSSYEYVSFAHFLEKCSKYEDIIEWGQKNYIWEMIFNLADRAATSGKLVFARRMYSDMSSCMPDLYFKKLAESRLLN